MHVDTCEIEIDNFHITFLGAKTMDLCVKVCRGNAEGHFTPCLWRK